MPITESQQYSKRYVYKNEIYDKRDSQFKKFTKSGFTRRRRNNMKRRLKTPKPSSGTSSASKRIQVVVRVRPRLATDDAEDVMAVECVGDGSLQV